MNMYKWLEELKESRVKKAMPILSFPSTQLMNITVRELINSSDNQAKGMAEVAKRTQKALASVSLMDLSVEAECFGSTIVQVLFFGFRFGRSARGETMSR